MLLRPAPNLFTAESLAKAASGEFQNPTLTDGLIFSLNSDTITVIICFSTDGNNFLHSCCCHSYEPSIWLAGMNTDLKNG